MTGSPTAVVFYRGVLPARVDAQDAPVLLAGAAHPDRCIGLDFYEEVNLADLQTKCRALDGMFASRPRYTSLKGETPCEL